MDLFSYNFSREKESPPEPAPNRKPVLTVAQLCRQVRNLLERQHANVWVKGEISNYRRQSSGHHYFTLKDSEAQLACVLFRGDAQFVRVRLGDGLQIQALGDVSVYEARGQLQMIVRNVQEAGIGVLQARFEALKRRLAEEGLFDPDKKMAVPRFPEVIGIVTSPTGAAIQDMLHILRRRAPWVRVLLCPVRVQGEGADAEIANAIRYLGTPQPGLPRIDTLVVARGGGSLEDLWNFNEESVARALAACPLPTVSAVGHEIDFTIADFAADLRAPTPSAAAELIVPDQAELGNQISRWRQSLDFRIRQMLDHQRRILTFIEQGSLHRLPERWLAENRQTIDGWRDSLAVSAAGRLDAYGNLLNVLSHRLEAKRPEVVLQGRRNRLELLEQRVDFAMKRFLTSQSQRVDHLGQVLKSLGPEAVLSRGFSLTLNAAGRLLRSAAEVSAGDTLRTRFQDGEIVSVAG